MIDDDRDTGASVCEISKTRQASEVGRPVVIAQVILLKQSEPRKERIVQICWKRAANTAKIRTCLEMRREDGLDPGAQPQIRGGEYAGTKPGRAIKA